MAERRSDGPVFGLYLDDSGHVDNTELFVVGGCIATADQWCAFYPRWQKALDDNGLTHFHAADCAGGHGEFEEWKPLRRAKFHSHMAAIVRESVHRMVGRAVIVEDYRRILAEEPDFLKQGHQELEMTGKLRELHFVLRTSIEYAALKADIPDGEQTAVIFEDGTKHLTAALDYCRALKEKAGWAKGKFSTVGSAAKLDLLPLQAADCVAYETFRRLTEIKARPWLSQPKHLFRDLRGPLSVLLQGHRLSIKVWNYESLRNWADDIKAGYASPRKPTKAW
jgi:hypothetical protein